MRSASLRQSILVPVAMVVLLLCALSLTFLVSDQINARESELRSDAATFIQALSPAAQQALVTGNLDDVRRLFANLVSVQSLEGATLFDRNGAVLAATARRSGPERAGVPGWFQRLLVGDALRYDERVVVDGVAYGTLRLEMDVRRELHGLWRLTVNYTLGSLVIVAALIGVLVLSVQRGLQPLLLLQDGARRLGAGDLDARVPAIAVGEIDAAARGFNAMAERLAASRRELDAYMTEVADSRNRLLTNQQALTAIIRSPVFWGADLPAAFRLITEQLATALGVARVGIWRRSRSGGRIRCADVWTASERRHTRGEEIAAEDAPAYFAALTDGGEIVADDACQHPLTRELATSYLTPHGITSLLDVPVHVRGACWGVVCCERSGPTTPWRGEDIAMATAAATLTAQAIEAADGRALNRALQFAKDSAEAANAAKNQFLSRMSHELRTPLHAILGFGQLLQMDQAELGPTHAENVSEIVRAGEHLLVMVNEVLDVARIESGHLDLRLETLAITEVLNDCATQMRPLAERRQIVLTVEGSDQLRACADRTRLQQVLFNLLSNAIKFNRDGGHVRLIAEPLGTVLRVEVSDTGRGIAPQQLPRLFMPFERGEAYSDGVEGTGIGLALAKQLVEAMGGRIDVTSQVGVGSTFEFTLPRVDENAADCGAARAASPSPGSSLAQSDGTES